jgi:hypothetical protein
MSATIMRYTSAWASLIPHIKSTVGTKHADVKVGVAGCACAAVCGCSKAAAWLRLMLACCHRARQPQVGIGLNFNALDMSETHKIEPGLLPILVGSGQRAPR